MSNEEIVIEIQESIALMKQAVRKVNGSLCHARNVIEKKEITANESDYARGLKDGFDCINFEVKKAYDKGLEDAWGVARKIFTTDCATLQKVLGSSDEGIIIMQNEPQAILAKVEACEKEQSTFKVGDVVMGDDDLEEMGVITWASGDYIYVMWSDGSCGQERNIETLHKTGKHIDVPEFLQKIGGAE